MHLYSLANAMLPSSCSWPMADHSQDTKISPFLGNRGLIWWLTQTFPKDFSTFLRLHRSLTFPPYLLHLEAELHDHLMALLVLASSFPIFPLINIPLIKSLHGSFCLGNCFLEDLDQYKNVWDWTTLWKMNSSNLASILL